MNTRRARAKNGAGGIFLKMAVVLLFCLLALSIPVNAGYQVVDAQTDRTCTTKGGIVSCQLSQTDTPRFAQDPKGQWLNFTDVNKLAGTDALNFNGKDNVTILPFITINGVDVDLSTFRLNSGAAANTRIIDKKFAWKFAFSASIPSALRSKVTSAGFRLTGATKTTTVSDAGSINLGDYQIDFSDLYADGWVLVKQNSTYAAFSHVNFSTGSIDLDPEFSSASPLTRGCVYGYINGTYERSYSVNPRVGNGTTICGKNGARWGAETFFVWNVSSIPAPATINYVWTGFTLNSQSGTNNKLLYASQGINNWANDNESNFNSYWAVGNTYNASNLTVGFALTANLNNFTLSTPSLPTIGNDLSNELQNGAVNYTTWYLLDRLTNTASSTYVDFKSTGVGIVNFFNVSYSYNDTPPLIELKSPFNNSILPYAIGNNNATFRACVQDLAESGVLNATLYLDDGTGWKANKTGTLEVLFGGNYTSCYKFTPIPLPNNQLITWNVYGCVVSQICAFDPDNFTFQYNTPTASVTLLTPFNGNVSYGTNANFTATASSIGTIINATFYSTLSGAWNANGTLNTPNDSSFYIDGIPDGVYTWNVLYCPYQGSCAFAPENFTLTITRSPALVNSNYDYNLYVFTIITALFLIAAGFYTRNYALSIAGASLLVIAGITLLAFGYTNFYAFNPAVNATNCTSFTNVSVYAAYNFTSASTNCTLTNEPSYFVDVKNADLDRGAGMILILAGILVYIIRALDYLNFKQEERESNT